MAGDLPQATTDNKPEQAPAPNDAAPAQEKPPKKSLYQRYVDYKTGRNIQISDGDMRKYTGMTKAELQEWAKDRPGVAGNQAAGKLAMGGATGLGGYETSQGYGGWGPDAEGKLKFPPKKAKGKEEDAKDGDDDD